MITEKPFSVTWDCKNHGGSPTTNASKKYAVFIGRWQPYHLGHIKMVERKVMQGIPVLIFIRDIMPDKNNPLTSQQTKQLIEKYHNSRGHDVLVKIIEDIESVNYGRGVGYEVNEWMPTEDIANISATMIRNSIYNGTHDWKTYIPQVIHSDVQKMLTYNDSNSE